MRCIVEEPWSEGCETLAVVYLEHLIAGFRQQQVAQFAAADVRGAYGMPRSDRYIAVAALGIVALHALGAENCLLLAVYCRFSIPPGRVSQYDHTLGTGQVERWRILAAILRKKYCTSWELVVTSTL